VGPLFLIEDTMSGNTTATSFYSLTFVVAKSPEALQKECLKNNLTNNKVFNYHSVQLVKGKWYAWYDKDLRDSVKVRNGSS